MMIADLHAHPVLPAYLYGRDLRRHWMSGFLANPLASRSDFAMLGRGGVRLLGSSLYPPALDMKRSALPRWAAHLMPHTRKLLHAPRWEVLLDMMRVMEEQIARAEGIELARSNAELDQILASGNTVLVHTIEGRTCSTAICATSKHSRSEGSPPSHSHTYSRIPPRGR